MKSDSPETLSKRAVQAASAAEVFLQVGSITRLLHDTLAQLGVMPRLQKVADGLPDARSRLNYITKKTAAAAGKVLNSVDHAKAEHACIADQTRRIAKAIVADPVKAVATGAVMNFVGDDKTGQFKDRDLYLVVYGQDGTCARTARTSACPRSTPTPASRPCRGPTAASTAWPSR